MKIIIRVLGLICTILLLSCASSGLTVRSNDHNDHFPNNKEIRESFYLVGHAAKKESEPVLDGILNKIKADTSVSKRIIFLGDNINETSKNGVTSDLDRQLEIVKKSKIPSYFVPGNLEWDFDGNNGLEFLEDYLESEIDSDEILTPNNGCPIESIEIDDKIHLIVIDSQWYIEDWDKHPEMNGKCEIKSRQKFLLEVANEIKKYANKTILFAMHHPMYTNGIHGGKFSFRDHIFPFGGDIPLPGIASLITEIRSQGAVSAQDRFNSRYDELMNELEIILNKDDQRIVLISGHERNLQYLENGNIKQIVSSAGGDPTPVSISDNGLFSYGQQGFARLDYLQDGSLWITYFGVDNNTSPLFEKRVFPPIVAPVLDSLPKTFPATFTTSIYDVEKVEKSDFFESFWGNHYRDVYGTQVTAKTAILDTLYGGLEVVRPGGGHQTKSLRLVSKDGKEYNMRALKKSAVQFLETTTFKDIDGEKYFKNTIPEDLILDFYTAAHPYGAFAIPKLAKAAKVYYTTPQLFYVPKQKALEKYNDSYGDELYMIVEKPSSEYEDHKNFGYPDDVESTDDLLAKLREDEDYIMDEEAYIRARIFDMLIGDWDRHSDQWRWAVFEDGNDKKVFVPIPRDRDQVFSNFDGTFLNLLRNLTGAVNQFGLYGEDIIDVAWFNKAGSKLDRALIKRSGKDVWIAQAKFLQQAMDLDLLDSAFKDLPVEVQDATILDIKSKFIARKNNLTNIVERYYNHFLKFQMLTGTDKDDHFEIVRTGNGKTQITAYRIKDGEKGDVLFDRTFSNDSTDEIWLYGLDDKDVFKVSGEADNPILIRLIGGQDEDEYRIEEGRKIKVYDRKSKPNKISKKGGAQFRFTDFYEANLYDYQKQRTTKGGINVQTGFNPDDGAILKAGYSKEVTNYIENPYGSRTVINLGYQFLTQGLELEFQKAYAAIFSDYNILFDGRFTSSNFTENFFGFGNETQNIDNINSLDYNRVNISYYNGGIGFERESDYGNYFQLKFDVQSARISSNGNNFILMTKPDLISERRYFAIPNLTYQFKNFDDEIFPTKGMLFALNLGGIDDLQSSNLSGFIKPSLVLYNSLGSNDRLILKSQARAHLTVGDRPIFYQAPQIGGETSLRGFRNQRFTGDDSFVGSFDLAYNLPKIKTFFFPIDISLYGGYDVGRVWTANDSSKVWHSSYGGGLMFYWTEAISGRFSTFKSDEGTRISFGFGLNF